jgi:hypothetical protein
MIVAKNVAFQNFTNKTFVIKYPSKHDTVQITFPVLGQSIKKFKDVVVVVV